MNKEFWGRGKAMRPNPPLERFPPLPPDRQINKPVQPFGTMRVPSLTYLPGTKRERSGPFMGDPNQQDPMRPSHWRWNTERGAQRPSEGAPRSVSTSGGRSRRRKRRMTA